MANHVVSKALLDKFKILDAPNRNGLAWDDAMKALSPYLWIANDGDEKAAALQETKALGLSEEERAVYDAHQENLQATSPQIKAALKGLWQEMQDEGISPDEFDSHYADATSEESSEEKQAAYDWVQSLNLHDRFSRHLEEVKKRHVHGAGKSHTNMIWSEDDPSNRGISPVGWSVRPDEMVNPPTWGVRQPDES